jgi:hypothetical protein
MVEFNDQLTKYDPQVEGIVNRFSANLISLLDSDIDKVRENLLVNDSKLYILIGGFIFS